MKLFPSEMSTTEYMRLQYELVLKEGQRRFGSECKHERVKNGRCVKCLRKVVG